VSDHAIQAEGLVKHYGEVTALDGLDLEVVRGTVLGLLGPNGAGKTTGVHILATILRPDRGRAHILGHDVIATPQSVREVIGLAGQFAAVDENLTGRENLHLVGKLTHLPASVYRARAKELLDRFDLVDAADRPAKTYSGGMRRRLDLASALVHRPPVLFLDEPTTGLDPHSRKDVWETVEALVAEGTTVLLTTQYLEEADRLADQVVVIDHGRAIASGTPHQLKQRLGTTVLEVELPGPREAEKAATLLHTVSPTPPVVDGSRVELTVDEGRRLLVEVVRLLDQEGVETHSLALREPSLDDVFLTLTGRRAEDQTVAKTPPMRKEVA
jgi:daunorubicin resistance ABC transporter ATP-binding subunit